MKYWLVFTAAIALQGCLGLGVAEMDAMQLRALEGIVTCTKLLTAYGQGVSVVVKDSDVRKGATATGKVTISPDCSTTIETGVGVAPVEVPK